MDFELWKIVGSYNEIHIRVHFIVEKNSSRRITRDRDDQVVLFVQHQSQVVVGKLLYRVESEVKKASCVYGKRTCGGIQAV